MTPEVTFTQERDRIALPRPFPSRNATRSAPDRLSRTSCSGELGTLNRSSPRRRVAASPRRRRRRGDVTPVNCSPEASEPAGFEVVINVSASGSASAHFSVARLCRTSGSSAVRVSARDRSPDASGGRPRCPDPSLRGSHARRFSEQPGRAVRLRRATSSFRFLGVVLPWLAPSGPECPCCSHPVCGAWRSRSRRVRSWAVAVGKGRRTAALRRTSPGRAGRLRRRLARRRSGARADPWCCSAGRKRPATPGHRQSPVPATWRS
jgi:hypothetical protein